MLNDLVFQLFDHIASCIAEFMRIHNLVGKSLPLGFTFSFPCKQEGLAIGRLVQWTKGFKCAGVEGENVVQLLQEAIKRRGVSVFFKVLRPDTIGRSVDQLITCCEEKVSHQDRAG